MRSAIMKETSVCACPDASEWTVRRILAIGEHVVVMRPCDGDDAYSYVMTDSGDVLLTVILESEYVT
jgi:hypothetical protein